MIIISQHLVSSVCSFLNSSEDRLAFSFPLLLLILSSTSSLPSSYLSSYWQQSYDRILINEFVPKWIFVSNRLINQDWTIDKSNAFNTRRSIISVLFLGLFVYYFAFLLFPSVSVSLSFSLTTFSPSIAHAQSLCLSLLACLCLKLVKANCSLLHLLVRTLHVSSIGNAIKLVWLAFFLNMATVSLCRIEFIISLTHLFTYSGQQPMLTYPSSSRRSCHFYIYRNDVVFLFI